MKRDCLFQQLERLRQNYRRRLALTISLVAVCALASLLLLAVSVDLLFHLPFGICWFFWGLIVLLAAAGIFFDCRRIRRNISYAATARLVEQAFPENDNHLINAVQLLERVPEHERLVDELLAESDLNLAEIQSRQLFDQRPLKWARISLVVLLFFYILLILLTPKGTVYAVARVLVPMAGIEPYTLTRIVTINPGNTDVLRGDSLDVTVTFSGMLPKSPRIVFERGRGKVEELPLQAASEKGEQDTAGNHSVTMQNIFYDSKYRIIGGDTKSDWYNVTVTNPPALEYWEAKVVPPEYTGRETFRIKSTDSETDVPVESEIVLGGAANCELQDVTVTQDNAVLARVSNAGREKFAAKFKLRDGGPVLLDLVGMSTLKSSSTLPFVIRLDQSPLIQLIDTEQRVMASKDAQVPVHFKASDDYGIKRVGIEQLDDQNAVIEQIAEAAPVAPQKIFNARFVIDIQTFQAEPGDNLRFRLWAEDNGRNSWERRGYSVIFQVSLPRLEEERKARKALAQQSQNSVLELIKLQRENLKSTRQLTEEAILTQKIPNERLQEVHQAQTNVRDVAVSLLSARAALGDLANVISGLVNHEMVEVLEKFDEIYRSKVTDGITLLNECVRLETTILSALTGIPSELEQEQQHQEKTDILEALQKLVAGQRANLKASLAEQRNSQVDENTIGVLTAEEDKLAQDLINFTDHCLVFIEARVDDDFAKQLRQAYDIIEKGGAYEKMLNAAEALELKDLAGGVQNQEEALKVLLQALDVLNLWRMRNAEKVVKDATALLEEVAEKLGELEKKQSEIAEVTRDLSKRDVMDDEVREKLREMDKEQEEMAELVEQLAQDLYQFPELPVCNELNSKMREIYEDVEQALDSENAPAIEIAVQKEDSLLDAIRNTKERVEDVEMWLPDVPDNIVWNMESFDTDEFPDIPLVPLPDQLEDLVGELLDQAASIDAQSQDTTGNNIIADMEMGWGVMDGPMPSFSAKGKSGNTRPNDNEMTGRSGAGREGQSTGELVENHVKGLEGRETHARRTRDPFQTGMVTEDENSTLDARSTGGGKLGGESETIGMFGNAPRRDLHLPDHGMSPTQLRRETEALYATARLLYLGTGSLGTAARELRGIESAPEKIKSFGSLHRRVVRRLEDTQVELSGGVVLPMPVSSVSKTGGAVVEDIDIKEISEEYRDIVSDYYRSLDK